MKLNIKKAILLPFSGKGWFLRLIVISFLSFSMNTYYYNKYSFIPMLFLAFLFLGYFSQFAHNEINDINPTLPSWKLDLLKYFKYGFICFIGLFIYAILLGIIISLIGTLVDIFKIGFWDNLNQIMSNIELIFIILIQCIYSEKFKFKDLLNFLKPIKIILNNKLVFLSCILIIFISDKIAIYYGSNAELIYIKHLIFLVIKPLGYLILINILAQAYKGDMQKTKTIITEGNTNYAE